MKLVDMKTFNKQNQYVLTGSKGGRKPGYLKMIKYVYEHRDQEYFSKYELLVNSDYHYYGKHVSTFSRKELISSAYNCELFSALGKNEILVYNKSKKKWTIGKNFDEWCNQYYPEVVPVNTTNTNGATVEFIGFDLPVRLECSTEISKETIIKKIELIEKTLNEIKGLLN